MAITDRAREIVARMYIAYGTDSGILLGLAPNQRKVVEAIVQFAIDEIEDND